MSDVVVAFAEVQTTFDFRREREDNLSATTFSAAALPSGRYRVWLRAISATNTAPWSPVQDFIVD